MRWPGMRRGRLSSRAGLPRVLHLPAHGLTLLRAEVGPPAGGAPVGEETELVGQGYEPTVTAQRYGVWPEQELRLHAARHAPHERELGITLRQCERVVGPLEFGEHRDGPPECEAASQHVL